MADRVSAVGASGGQSRARRVRKSSRVRRAELLGVAREVVAGGGLVEGGMAEVAAAAGVSPGLLYHYFPGGRTELVDAVAFELLDDLSGRMAVAAGLPFSPMGRLEQVLAAMFGFFADQPVAFPLLFAEPGVVVGDDGVHHLAHVRLVSAMTSLMAGSARGAEELMAAAVELLGTVRAELDGSLRGEATPEQAWRASCRRATELFAEPD